ncbi:MAG: hypothetical protein V1712_00965 [Patescibacteria group bacterium]
MKKIIVVFFCVALAIIYGCGHSVVKSEKPDFHLVFKIGDCTSYDDDVIYREKVDIFQGTHKGYNLSKNIYIPMELGFFPEIEFNITKNEIDTFILKALSIDFFEYPNHFKDHPLQPIRGGYSDQSSAAVVTFYIKIVYGGKINEVKYRVGTPPRTREARNLYELAWLIETIIHSKSEVKKYSNEPHINSPNSFQVFQQPLPQKVFETSDSLPKNELANYEMVVMDVPTKKKIRLGNLVVFFNNDAQSVTQIFKDSFQNPDYSILQRADEILWKEVWPPLRYSNSESISNHFISARILPRGTVGGCAYQLAHSSNPLRGMIKVTFGGDHYIVYGGWLNSDGSIADTVKVTAFVPKETGPKEINIANVENLKKAGIKSAYIQHALDFQGITPEHFQTAFDSTGIDFIKLLNINFIKLLNGEADQDSVKVTARLDDSKDVKGLLSTFGIDKAVEKVLYSSNYFGGEKSNDVWKLGEFSVTLTDSRELVITDKNGEAVGKFAAASDRVIAITISGDDGKGEQTFLLGCSEVGESVKYIFSAGEKIVSKGGYSANLWLFKSE